MSEAPQDAPLPPAASPRLRVVGLLVGAGACALMLLLQAPEGLSPAGWRTAAVAVLMATWWMTEAIPIPATALLPLALFPLLGIGAVDETAAPYANPLIFLFLGGFLIATAMQRWGLHRRIALRVIGRVGTSPRAIIGGFMAAAALLSMWVTNTATALMLLPVALSVIALADAEPDARARSRFAAALLLGLAYACNIGGMGTLVGTAPNALLAAFVEEQYGITLSFVGWLAVGGPLVLVGVPLAYLVLTRLVFPVTLKSLPGGRALVDRELKALGRMGRGERIVAVVFALTALLWITRPLLQGLVPGLSDAGIAVAGGVVLFVLPVDWRRGTFAHDWAAARALPWGTLLLFGGGLSLAAAFTRTGLSAWIGGSLQGLGALPSVALVLVVAGVVIALTELTSNTATTATFLPVLAALAVGLGQNPLLLAVPATLAASCAFMLPVATPPNAIVYGSGRLAVPQMARAGLWLNGLFLLLIVALAYTALAWAFGVAPGEVPAWAAPG